MDKHLANFPLPLARHSTDTLEAICTEAISIFADRIEAEDVEKDIALVQDIYNILQNEIMELELHEADIDDLLYNFQWRVDAMGCMLYEDFNGGYFPDSLLYAVESRGLPNGSKKALADYIRKYDKESKDEKVPDNLWTWFMKAF